MRRIRPYVLLLLCTCSALLGCSEDEPLVLLFSLDDDIQLGKQLQAEILNDPSAYPLLSKTQYRKSYRYLEDMRDNILASERIKYKDTFDWTLNIIDDNETLNAFVAPGGYIYVYTGLIHFLENEDDLAGVLGHEIAHADRRHTSRQLQKQFGIQLLLDILTGDKEESLVGVLGTIAGSVNTLRFGQKLESEADEYSVYYLAHTKYACNGAAAFFQKLISNPNYEEDTGLAAFLSTHPPSSKRVEDINNQAQKENCSTKLCNDCSYQGFKKTLPQ